MLIPPSLTCHPTQDFFTSFLLSQSAPNIPLNQHETQHCTSPSFSLKHLNMHLNVFLILATLHLTPYTLYKTLMLLFHTTTPLKREKPDLHIEAPKHFFYLEALLSSFLLLYSSHLKTAEYCWWVFWSCEQAQEAMDLLH